MKHNKDRKVVNKITGVFYRINVKILLSSILAAPLSVVLHELGHAVTAISVGYSNVYITYHSWGGKMPIDILSVERALISSGGPIFSFLIAVVCVLIVLVNSNLIFPKALGILASVQFTGALIYVIGSIFGLNVSTVFDSARVAQYLNTSIFITSLPGSLVFIFVWIFFTKSLNKENRLADLSSIIVGGIIGFFIWFFVIGPIILP